MDQIEVNFDFELLVAGHEPCPIRLILVILVIRLFLCKLSDHCKNIIIVLGIVDLLLLLLLLLKLLLLMSLQLALLLLLVIVRDYRLAHSPHTAHPHAHRLGLAWVCCILLSFHLVSELIFYIRALPGNLLRVQKQSDLALTIAQIFFTLGSNPISGTYCLGQSLILDQSISFIWFHGWNLDFYISQEPKFLKSTPNMGFGIIWWLILQGCIHYRHKIFLIIETNRIGDHIPSLDMIGKKYFEVWIWLIVMDPIIYIMVLCACIGSTLNAMKFNISKITNNLYFLNLSIQLHDVFDIIFIHLLQPTDKKLADQNVFMNFLYGFCFVFYLLLPTQWHVSENFEQFGFEMDLVAADCCAKSMLDLFGLSLRVGLGYIVASSILLS